MHRCFSFVSLTILVFTIATHSLVSQEIVIPDSVVSMVCECLGQIAKSQSADEIGGEMGMCMHQAMLSDSDLAKKFDFAHKGEEASEKFGRLIGMRLVTVCPESFMPLIKLLRESPEEETPKAEESQNESATGHLSSISLGPISNITVNVDGSPIRFIVFNRFEGWEILKKPLGKNKGRRVIVKWYETTVFNSTLKSFETKKMITSLQFD